MLNRSASLAMSTSVLKALPGKLDIKRHSPSILYLSGIAIYRKERSFRGRKVPSAEGRFLYGRKLLNKFISKIIL